MLDSEIELILRLYGIKPSTYMKMSKKQLAYKLAELASYLHVIGKAASRMAFQKHYANWVETTGDPITVKDIQVKVPKWLKKVTK